MLVKRETDSGAPRWHPYAHYVRAFPARLEEIAPALSVGPGDRVLDYGCGDVPYRSFFPDNCEFVAADLPGNPRASLELNADSSVPEPDASFDAVLSTQVLEHVEDPGLYLSECHRVLRPGGQLMLSTHGVFVYHPDPDDYWRWTSAGLRRALTDAGFEVIRFEGVIGLMATGIQLVQDSVYHRLPRWLRPVVALLMQGLVAIADRVQGRRSRSLNAAVFVAIGRK